MQTLRTHVKFHKWDEQYQEMTSYLKQQLSRDMADMILAAAADFEGWLVVNLKPIKREPTYDEFDATVILTAEARVGRVDHPNWSTLEPPELHVRERGYPEMWFCKLCGTANRGKFCPLECISCHGTGIDDQGDNGVS